MGNSLRSPQPKKSSSKEEEPSNLCGLEIVIDHERQDHQSMISGMFHEDNFEDPDESTNIDHSDSTISFRDQKSEPRKSSGSRKSRKGTSKTGSGGRLTNEDVGDLMTCMIPGMDPMEMLNLVQECAEEDSKEKAIILRKASRARIRRERAERRRSGR